MLAARSRVVLRTGADLLSFGAMSTPRMVPGRGLKAQLETLAALGLDLPRLLRELGPDCALERLEDAACLVPADRFDRMWAIAHAQDAREDLAVALACSIPFGAFGILDYLIGSADTVGAALESLQAHFRLATYEAKLELDEAGGTLRVTLRPEGTLAHDASEFMLASIAHRLIDLSGKALRPTALRFTRAAPANPAAYGAWFSGPISFDSPVAELELATACAELPLKRADPLLQQTLARVAATLHLGAENGSELEQALRARLRDALADGGAAPAALARRLGMSERTLQRRLESQGRSFSEIVEGFRHEESLRLLREPDTAVAEVAARLGYEEQSSFTRAFRRWTGTTPASWRKSQAR